MPRRNDPSDPKLGPEPTPDPPRARPRRRPAPAPTMATVDDVALRWGHDPSDSEAALIELRLADAERMILHKIPDLRLKIAAGDIFFEDVVRVESDAVVRLMRNPEGYISETDGDYSYQVAKELSSGRLGILDDEWDLLGWRKATMSILVPEPQVEYDWDDDFDGDPVVAAAAGSGILLVLAEADLPADGDAKLACTTDSATLWIKNPSAATANPAGWVQVGAASKLPTGQHPGQLMSWNDVSQGWEPAKYTWTQQSGSTLVWSAPRNAWVASENRLQDATDVDASSRAGGGALATGDVLSYDAASQRWLVKAPSDFLSQMVITAAAAGDVLTWDGTNWVNAGAYTKAEIDGKLSGLASGLARKPAVQDILTAPPAAPTTGPNYIIGKSATGDWAGHDNEVVFWSGSAWVFSAATKGDTHTVVSTNTSMTWNGTDWVSVGSQASKLGELSDVTLGAVPAKNDAVMWDGSKWINQPVPKPTAGPVSDHTDVDTTGAKDKDHLAFVAADGMWKPTPALDHTLDGLGDTALPSVLNAGDVVVWDASAQKWTAKAPSGLSVALDGLLDVNAGAPVDGDILRWDAAAGEWINRVLSGDLAGLSDVDVSVLDDGDMLVFDGAKWVPTVLRLEDGLDDVMVDDPQNEDFLVFNGAQWENRPVPLGGLSDLALTAGTDGDVLTFDGGVWINQAPAAVPTTLGALTDVTTSTPVDGQVLTFDNATSQWVNQQLPAASASYPVTLGYQHSDSDHSRGKILWQSINAEAGHTYKVSGGITANYNNEDDRFRASLHEKIGSAADMLLTQSHSTTWGGDYNSQLLLSAVVSPGVDGSIEFSMYLDGYSEGVVLRRSYLLVEDLGLDASSAPAPPVPGDPTVDSGVAPPPVGPKPPGDTVTVPWYTKPEVDTKLETLVTGLAHGESVNSITATPPSAPVEGDLVIVATGATGAFAGHVNSLALWDSGKWVFTPPEANETHLVEDQDALFHWNGTTWVKIASTTAATGSTAKRGVGEIIPWLADTVPDGYLECKGQAVAISAYPDLYAVLGNKYNAGTGADGTTTFSLPDLRGYFLRGTGANGGEVNVGVVQSDTTRLPRTAFTTSTAGSHSHWNGKKEYVDDPNVFAYGKKSLNTYGWVGSNTDGFNQGVAATSTDGAHTHTIGGGDAETRPKSVSVKWIIRTVAINGGAQGPKGEKGDSAYSVTLMAMIGDIKQSVLTETQFINVLPTAERHKWVLADGRNVTGTAYASVTGRNTIPDLRGAYLRMAGQNNNAGWNGGTLNDWQEDTTRRPRNTAFTTDSQGNHGHNFGNDSMLVTASWGGGHDLAVGPGGNPEGLQTFHHDGAHTHTINGGGDTETRPKTYSVNYFIKVDN